MTEDGTALAIEPVLVPVEPPPPRRPAPARTDAVMRAIEASYAPEPNLQRWLEGIFRELDGLGLGTWGGVPVSEGLQVVGARMIVPGAGVFLQVNERATRSREILRDFHRAACVPSSRVVNVQDHWAPFVLQMQGSLSASELAKLFGMTVPAATAVLCTSTDGQEGVVAMLDNTRPIPARIRHQLEGVAAHIEHAYRLRRGLGQWTREKASAVLSPEGKLLHAEPRAVSEAPSLTHAVKESEKARGALRRLSPEEAVETWQALVEGQWSIAEHVEHGGVRLLLAFENAPVTSALKLSPQERRVVSYAALGHSQKYIAYELGLTPSHVSRTLSSALRKLRLKSLHELISVLGPRGVPSQNGHRDQ